MTSHEQTPNHGLYVDGQGEPNWQYEADMRRIESRLLIRDSVGNASNYQPHDGALLLADDGQMRVGDGSVWTEPPWRDFYTIANEHDTLRNDHDTLRSEHDDLEAAAAKTADDETITGTWGFDQPTTVSQLTVGDNDPGTSADIALTSAANISSDDSIHHLVGSSSGEINFGFGNTIRDGISYALEMSGDGTVNAPGTLMEASERVATRTWVSNNTTEYTDNDARAAVTAGPLSGTIEGLDGMAFASGIVDIYANDMITINIDSSSNVDISNGALSEQGDRVGTRTWVQNSATAYDSDRLNGKFESDLSVDWATYAGQADNALQVDGYDVMKNGTDGDGNINFKT